MHSPYKHMQGRHVERLDLLLLDGLSHCKGPASTDAVMQISDPRGFAKLDLEQVVYILTVMLADGYVERIESAAFSRDPSSQPGQIDRLRWQITDKGRAHLVASETRAIIDDVTQHTPVRRAVREEKANITEQLRASHARLDSEGVPRATCCNSIEPRRPAIATVSLDEDELDDWFYGLDVEAKAAAFCEYSFATRVCIADPRRNSVPLAGVVGDLKPETVDALKHLAEAAVPLRADDDGACTYCYKHGRLVRHTSRIADRVEIVRFTCTAKACIDSFHAEAERAREEMKRNGHLHGEPLRSSAGCEFAHNSTANEDHR